MSKLKFSTDLLLETIELTRLQSFLDDSSKTAIVQNTDQFGLFHNFKQDATFDNGRVYQDSNDASNNICVKIMPLLALDGGGNFLYKGEETKKLIVPNDNSWYWIKISYQQSVKEVGTYSIDVAGNFICTSGNGDFTNKLRGYPNFPTKIRFLNSSSNSNDYEVLTVVDDNHALLASNSFLAESDLTYGIYGTFTPDHSPLPENEFPFRFDDAKIDIIAETNGVNVSPSYSRDYEFYLARVKINSGLLTIEDKRYNFIHRLKNPDIQHFIKNEYTNTNGIVGIESVKWKNKNVTNEENQVKITWGFLIDTWNIDPNNNQIVLLNGKGGVYKSTNDLPVGYFLNWRIYTENGNYHTILSSSKTGSVITLKLDTLLADNFFDSSTINKLTEPLVIVPPANIIEFKFIPDSSENNQSELVFTTDIKKGYATFPVPVYAKDAYYRLYYRLISSNLTKAWQLPSSNPVGYLTEASFTEDGVLKDSAQQILYPYTPNDTLGFLQLKAHSDYYPEFKRRTTINVNESATVGFQNNQNYIRLHGGISPMRQIVSGNTLSSSFDDLYISLESDTAEEGTQFFIFLKDDLNLTDTKLHIVRDYVINVTPTLIKTIDKSDIGIAINSEKGISIELVYTNSSWLVIEHYTKLPKFEMLMFHSTMDEMALLFDSSGGIAKPYKGYLVCNGVNGTPNMMGNFAVGFNPSDTDFNIIGKKGGSSEVRVNLENLPSHQHTALFVHYEYVKDNTGSGASKVVPAYGGDDFTGTPAIADGTGEAQTGETNGYKTSFTGGTSNSKPGEAIPMKILPPYIPVLHIKRNF